MHKAGTLINGIGGGCLEASHPRQWLNSLTPSTWWQSECLMQKLVIFKYTGYKSVLF